MFPLLSKLPVKIFFEVNLSQDIAVSVQRSVREYYSLVSRNFIKTKWVKQYDSKGKLMTGILTRNKANLVSYFTRVLNEDMLFISREISTVSRIIERKYGSDQEMIPFGLGHYFPTLEDMNESMETLHQQARMFRAYRNNNSVIFSGKREKNGKHYVDDMLMALILSVSWARMPSHSYTYDSD